MHSRFVIALKYLWYLLSAKSGKGHGIHSPFIYSFVRKVLMDCKPMEAYGRLERLRKDLLRDVRILPIEDMGAGSSFTSSFTRSVASIALNAAKPPKFGRLLNRMIYHYEPDSILEMGTSLGISTAYMALAAGQKTVHTIEGSQAIAQVAAENFLKAGLSNVQLIQGNFDHVLAPFLNTLPSIDFVFIDGNHRKEPTLRYFRQLMDKRSGQAILVFDDIHWSNEMEDAWREIKSSPDIKLTVDLFFVGIVFFHPSFRASQHFRIRY